MKMKVFGWRHSKGNYEGTDYDNLTLYSSSKLKQTHDSQGSAGIEVKAEPSLQPVLQGINFDQVQMLDVEMELRAGSKGQYTQVVVSITLPVQAK